eukprot:TRINITY_DN9988_c0_g1_i1.p1 TRINITY_DN9988_c0_g1~~TRINITY_DN9988_c0_g1_i1.p1  ORF type:complete len:360 (-),score=31.30 TRINITY_DN9988_c0_g1_i1:69-1148(-)
MELDTVIEVPEFDAQIDVFPLRVGRLRALCQLPTLFEHFVVAQDDKLYLCDAVNGILDQATDASLVCLAAIPLLDGRASAFSFLSLGKIARNNESILTLWKVVDNRLIQVKKKVIPRPFLQHLCVLSDQQNVVLASCNKTLERYSINLDEDANLVAQTDRPLISVILALPGNRFVCGDFSQSIDVWDGTTMTLLHTIPIENGGRGQKMYDMTFVPGTGLIVGGQSLLQVFDVDSYQMIHNFDIGNQSVFQLLPMSKDFVLFEGVSLSCFNVVNLVSKEVSRMKLEGCTGFDKSCEIACGDGLLSFATEQIRILRLGGKRWQRAFYWLFLGQRDSNSILCNFPSEILYHMVGLTKYLRYF